MNKKVNGNIGNTGKLFTNSTATTECIKSDSKTGIKSDTKTEVNTTKITVNSDININVDTAGASLAKSVTQDKCPAESQKTEKEGVVRECSINHDEDVLIDNDVTFFGLLDLLRGCPEALKAEKEEAKRKEEEQELKKIFGENYSDYVTVEEPVSHKDELKKMDHRPGANQLWNKYRRVAVKKIESGGRVDVYENGYAVYDNGNRRTVVWVPDCGTTTYYFAPLREIDKGRIKQKETIGEDVFGSIPWYHAIVIAGENSIELNIDHPMSIGTASEFAEIEEYAKPGQEWGCCSHIETPEEAFFRKEAERERRAALTEKQREVYDLYVMGFNQNEIAKKIGIGQNTVHYHMESIKKRLRKNSEIFF